jgi:hypothetical protein
MPRHLISDAHEWINEIPTVPGYHLAKPQPRERAWPNQRGKKTLLRWELKGDLEIPLLLSFLYLFSEAEIDLHRSTFWFEASFFNIWCDLL